MNPAIQRAVRRWRRSRVLLVLLPLGATLAFGLLAATGKLESLENGLYDLRLRTFKTPPVRSRDLLIVALDDAALQGIGRNPSYQRQFGAWPYTRNLWSVVLARLNDLGARAVVADFTFDEARGDQGQDQNLADLIRERHLPFYFCFNVNAGAFGQTERSLPSVQARNRFPLEASAANAVDAVGDDGFGEPPPPSPQEIASALAFPVTLQGVALPDLRERADEAGAGPRRMRSPIAPITPLLRAAAGFGLALPEEDPSDGIMRRTHFAYSDGHNTYVNLAVAVAADLFHAEKLELSPGHLKLGARELAVGPTGEARLDYGGSLDERFESRSLLALLNDWAHAESCSKHHQHCDAPVELGPESVRGRVILLAGFALGTNDVKATPFSPNTPGAMKQATELQTFLNGRFITDLPFWNNALLALALSVLAAALVLGSGSTLFESAWMVLAPLTLFLVTGLVLVLGKHNVALAFSGGALLLTSVTAVTFNHLYARREGAQIKGMFSRYVAKQVVDQLVLQPERLRLDGENLEITAFFSDIRGFSTFSEKFKNDPKGLVTLLNLYLTRVSGTLQKHGACLDKYIGDAVVAIFGAPLRLEDHAVRACRAALEVQSEIQALRTEFLAKGLPDVYTRIGMNSAVMFVGNFGSEQLFNYTAMGDGMNLASRLEGANKAYDSLIMIGPRTYELAQGFIEARELDRVRVAGKTEAVTVYELLALKGELPPEKARAVASYSAALNLFRDQRFQEAASALEASLRAFPDDGPSQKLLKRCLHYLDAPPGAGFDGVANLDK